MAVRRLHRDLLALQRSQNPQIAVRPAEGNILEWHFVLHSLPNDTPYHAGCYHGKVVFPPEYPHAPPAIVMVTPNGRLEVGRRLCLSMTDFHPESWNPAWSVETILVGLLSFFISDKEKGYGAISAPEDRRRVLADASWAFNNRNAEFRQLFPEFLRPGDYQLGADDEEPEGLSGSGGQPPLASAVAPQEAATLEVQQGNRLAAAAQSINGSRQGLSALELAEPTGPENVRSGGAVALAAGPPAEGRAPAQEDVDGDGPMECWICRDTTSSEPLIQPCACRGSMSGVHASCVEQWIRHHRRNAVNSEVPRCSVCHQQYSGYEQRPGVAGFVGYLCYDTLLQLVRSFVLLFLVFLYKETANPRKGDNMPLELRVVCIGLFSLAAVHKVLVLTVSLPPHRAPPRNNIARRFFEADFRKVALHMSEAFTSMVLLAYMWLSGTLPLECFLPFALLGLVPVGKLLLMQRLPSSACLRRCAVCCLSCLFLPVIILASLARVVWNNPRRVAIALTHPLHGGPHVLLAITVMVLCYALQSNVPLVVIWSVHSFLVLAGLCEIHLVGKLKWQDGYSWWLALQVTVLAVYAANVTCEFSEGIPASNPREIALVVLGASLTWLFLVSSLALSINWSICVQNYRTWQNRHGVFTLQVPAQGAQGAAVEV